MFKTIIRTKHILLVVAVIAGLSIQIAGCANMVRDQRLVEKAAWDLKCSKDQISYTEINSTTYGVTGCQKRASYVMVDCSFGFWRSCCKAVLNGPIYDE